MKLSIRNRNNFELKTIEAWKKGFEQVDDSKHWEPGYSAHSLGVFFTSGKGEKWLEEMTANLLGEVIEWDDARIEHESKLDFYVGKHRMQDLALWGKTSKGEKVFVGIEAKVLESFGNYSLRDEYENAVIYKKYKKPTSNKPDRVKDITSFLFPGQTPYDEKVCNLRYQLMHYFTGSIREAPTYGESKKSLRKRKEGVDIVILPILVFTTDHYHSDTSKADLNESDFKKFCNALGLTKKRVMGKDVWMGMIDGKRIYSFYEKINP